MILIPITTYIYFYIKYKYVCPQNEQKINQEFYEEIAKTPGIVVEKFSTFDCDGWADLNINNKGSASIFYSGKGKISIKGVPGYSTSFTCYNIDTDGRPTRYVADLTLQLTEESPYKRWFPFKIESLEDLAVNYDQMIDSLEKLPKNPEMVQFKDSWGDRQIVKNPNPDYRLYTKLPSGWPFLPQILTTEVACDLYTISSNAGMN